MSEREKEKEHWGGKKVEMLEILQLYKLDDLYISFETYFSYYRCDKFQLKFTRIFIDEWFLNSES